MKRMYKNTIVRDLWTC